MHSHEETKSVSSGGKEGEAKQTDRQTKQKTKTNLAEWTCSFAISTIGLA